MISVGMYQPVGLVAKKTKAGNVINDYCFLVHLNIRKRLYQQHAGAGPTPKATLLAFATFNVILFFCAIGEWWTFVKR